MLLLNNSAVSICNCPEGGRSGILCDAHASALDSATDPPSARFSTKENTSA
jgi:hypothetical protein